MQPFFSWALPLTACSEGVFSHAYLHRKRVLALAHAQTVGRDQAPPFFRMNLLSAYKILTANLTRI